jgi:hypothetical protein
LGQTQYQWSSADNTWKIVGTATGVSAGTYGDGSNVGQFTVNAAGQVTFAQNVPISSSAGGTVTSIVAGTGLTGGTITASGTIALNTTYTDARYLQLSGGTLTGNVVFAVGQTFPGVGTVTSVIAGTGLTGGTITSTGTISLADTAVAPGSYTYSSVTVDQQGRLTAASSGVSPVTSITAGTGLGGGTITSTGTVDLLPATSSVIGGVYPDETTLTVSPTGQLSVLGGGGVTTFAGGTTGLTPTAATSGAVTLGGILAIANGGTGATTQAAAQTNILPTQTGNAGKFLTTDGAGSVTWANPGDPVSGTATFTSSGTWTAPAGVTTVTVSMAGGGGGGGGQDTGGGGGGGGGGGQRYSTSSTVVPGTTYTVTVGTGGAWNVSGGAGGGTSTFNGINATGGAGGISAGGGEGAIGYGGAGGSPAGNNGSDGEGTGNGGNGGIGGSSVLLGYGGGGYGQGDNHPSGQNGSPGLVYLEWTSNPTVSTLQQVTDSGATTTDSITTGGLVSNGDVILGAASTNTLSVAAQISSSLIPSANETYDLGSATKAWNTLYVKSSSIYLGTNKLSICGGQLALNGGTVGGNPATPSVLGAVMGISDTFCFNTALGYDAGSGFTDGTGNTAIGRSAGSFISTGENNTYIGAVAGTGTNGTSNVGIGVFALGQTNAAVFDNIAIGNFTMATATGSCNIAIGSSALPATTGTRNIAIGNGALLNATTSDNNVGIGWQALLCLTTGRNNLEVGANNGTTDIYSPPFQITNQCNRVVLGSSATTNAYVQVAWTVVSDERDKTEITALPVGLDFVTQLEPISYRFKESRDSDVAVGDTHYGFSAQQVLKVEGENPVVVDTEDLNKLKITDSKMIPILVQAIKELKAEIDELKSRG